MRRSTFLGASAAAPLICAVLAACPPPVPEEVPGASVILLSPVAVGSTLVASPKLECTRPGTLVSFECERHSIQAINASADDPSMFDVSARTLDPGEAQLVVKAKAPGRSMVRVEITDHDGGVYPIQSLLEALEVDRVTLQTSCGDPAARSPYLFPAGSRILLTYQLFHGQTALHGIGKLPVDGGSIRLVAADLPNAYFDMPAGPRADAITSPVDPALNLQMESYDLSSIDTVDAQVAGGFGPGPFGVSLGPTSIPVNVTWSIGGRAPCGRPGTVTDGVLTTPFRISYSARASGPCWLDPDGGAGLVTRSAQITVNGYSEGLCEVTATVDGGTGQGTAPVWYRSWIPRAPDPKWSYDNPLPLGSDVLVLGGSGGSDVWAGDELGALHHFTGSSWRALPAPGPHEPIFAVWSAASDNAWAGGAHGTLYSWNGVSWTWIQTGLAEPILGLWGRSRDDVWAAAGGGKLLHWDGIRWSRIPSGTRDDLTSVWGTATSMWVGSTGGVLRWDGTSLVQEVTDAAPAGHFLSGTGPGDVWAAGASTFHFDGNAWQPVDTGGVALGRIAAVAAGKAWAVGDLGVYGWDGQQWSLSWAQPSLSAVWANGTSDAWAAGRAGLMGRWNGASWSQVTSGVSPAGAELSALWGSSEADLWAVGRASGSPPGIILHRQSPGWAIAATGLEGLNAVWGSGATDAWAAGDQGTVLHWTGGAWTAVPSGTTNTISAIWGSGPSDVYFAGSHSLLLHWDGQALSQSLLGNCPSGCGDSSHTAIWGSGPSDVWVGGFASWSGWDLWHWDGRFWTSMSPGFLEGDIGVITGLWGSGPLDLWVTTTSVTAPILRWNGAFWNQTYTAYPAGPVRGFGSSDVWFGNIHFDGSQWAIFDSPSPTGPLWGTDSNHMWTLGRHASVLRRGP